MDACKDTDKHTQWNSREGESTSRERSHIRVVLVDDGNLGQNNHQWLDQLSPQLQNLHPDNDLIMTLKSTAGQSG